MTWQISHEMTVLPLKKLDKCEMTIIPFLLIPSPKPVSLFMSLKVLTVDSFFLFHVKLPSLRTRHWRCSLKVVENVDL